MSTLDLCVAGGLVLTSCGCASATPRTFTGPAWEPVRFIHRGVFCAAPCDFPLYVRVEPRAANRVLWVSCTAADGIERVSGVELNAHSPAMQDRFLFKGLTAGDYHCTATVVREDGSTRTDTTQILVIGRQP